MAIGRGRRRARPQRLGPEVRRGAEAYLGHGHGVPGVGEDGARWLASTARARGRAPTRSPSSGWPPGSGHALLPAHRVLLVEARHLHHRGPRPGGTGRSAGLREFTVRAASRCNLVGATGLPGAAAGGQCPDALTRRWPSRSPGLRRRDAAVRPAFPPEVTGSVRQRVLDILGICVAATPLDTSAAARGWAHRPGRHAAGARGRAWPSRVPAHAGRLRQRRPGPLARLRRHAPALGAAPQRLAWCPPPGRRRDAGADGPSDRRGHCGGPGGLRPAGHGRLRRRPRRTRRSSSTASTPPRSAARWRPRCRRPCCWAWTPTGDRHAMGVAASMAGGSHRGQPDRRDRSSGCTAAGRRTPPYPPPQLVSRGFTGPPTRAGGPVRLLPGLAARPVQPGGHHRRPWHATGACRESSSSPTRPTTSPTRPSTRRSRCAQRGLRRRPTWNRAVLGVAAPTVRTIGEPIEVKRAPADRLHGTVQRALCRRRRAVRRRRPRRRAGRLHR